MKQPLLRIGTRGSPLALIQARLVRAALAACIPELAEETAVEVVPIVTSGDRVQDRTLEEIGGKGLFTREIEDGLLAGTLDLAVHSMKDMPTWLPEGLIIAGFLRREDPRDALLATGVSRIADLPRGAVVGTAALRRKAQLLHLRPDLVVVPFRGNVGTRIRKLREGQAQATLLAMAGLRRLGQAEIAVPVPVEDMLPAVGQGAICIECRAGDERLLAFLAAIGDVDTAACVWAEHALLAALDGSCRTPIAGHARLVGDGNVALSALIATPDGTRLWRAEGEAAHTDGPRLGRELGEQLRRDAGPAVLADWPSPRSR
jgi:hydroxymethylbilane synthase